MSVGFALRRWPLFARVFAVILAAVLAAQAINFALLLTAPLPSPDIYPISDIAAALQTGRSGPALAVGTGAPPSEASQTRRNRRLQYLVAQQLGVDPAKVRVQLSRPPRFWMGREPRPLEGREIERRIRDGREQRTGIIFGRFVVALQLPGGEWRLVRPVIHGIEPWQWLSLLWLLAAFAAAAPFAWIIARRVALPVRLFADAAERLGRDPSAPPLSIEGPREIADAAAAFNAMQERLRNYVADRTTMTAAIAHDLRTPLMRLSLILDDAPPEIRTAAEAEIREMKERIQATLAFMRGLSQPARRQRLNLRTLVQSMVDEASDRGAPVRFEGEDIVLDADVAGLKAMVANLVENAVQYGRNATVHLHRHAGEAIIEVADQGPGLPPAELERVFEPFYRVESSRNRETGGTGLGLASARAVARAHGGDIVLANRPEGGLSARVALPLHREENGGPRP
jgi:two-component system OmpR family sensor kinase